ncbi:MAG: formylglycine-generating enzyme family protein [Planctomycetia bacterium]
MPTSRLACLIIAVALMPWPIRAEAASAESQPGFVAGDTRPTGDGPAIRVPGGWMVAYDETIPGTDVTFRMLPVPGGTLRMGSPGTEPGRSDREGPPFDVTVAPFWMGRCEVTWREYKAYMAACDLFKTLQAGGTRVVTEANRADAITAPSSLYDPTMTFTNGENPAQPAVTMSQFAARQYTGWLSGLTGRFYRLPSESEWEHACRAGTTTPWSCGAEAAALADVAWFADNSDETTHPVGEKKPNAWGLHDMHGNAAEWVVDQLATDGYARQAALPQPVTAAAAIEWPTTLSGRVVRGGAYYDDPDQCRSATRRGSEDEAWKEVDPNYPKSPWWYTEEPALGVGMRLVRPLAEPAMADRRRWWDADLESIRDDVESRMNEGRGARAVVDQHLPADARAAGAGS